MVKESDAQVISEEIANIHAAAYERELSSPILTEITDLRVVCRIIIELNRADEVLLNGGSHDKLHDARAAFGNTLAPAFTAAVERATGRKVASLASEIDLPGRQTTLTFALAPIP